LKSLLLLWSKLAEESASWCGTSTTRDCKTVTCRSKHEGLSFLTITLPQFGKDFETSLDQCVVDPSRFAGFRRRGELPLFLGGFLDLVFDRGSGRLLNDPSIDAILAIRQLTLMFGKILLPASDRRTADAMRGFVECEQDVRVSDAKRSPLMVREFQRVSDMLFKDIFDDVDHKILEIETVLPKHGPGATADKLMGNHKFTQRDWPARIEQIFPARDFLFPNGRYYDDHKDEVNILEPGQELPVRVITVPKTLKTPRIIGIEPTVMQYMQQSILTMIRDAIDKNHNLSRIIGSDDQTPNQEAACRGSLHGDLATLDLSEASDRVSNQLVRDLLHPWPYLHGAVDATRSRKADVPGHGVIRLAKFATMGSALCFPMEAIVFTTLIFMGIQRDLNRPLTPRDVKRLRNQVRVYGDDIIVPVHHVSSVIHVLEAFGAKVNMRKSFWNGKFRESCGKEYYNGADISIVRVRRVFPTSRQDAQEVNSLVSLRNQLYIAGYWQTCRWLDGLISGIIKYYPVVLPTSPVIGRHSFLGYESQGYDENLHRPIVKGYVVSAKIPKRKLDDFDALTKFFLSQPREGLGELSVEEMLELGRQPSTDERHLERSGRPQAVNLKLRYSTPY